MKKILLSAAFAVPFLMNAQITLISEDFESYSDGDVLTDVAGDNGWREWGADFGAASAGYSSLASSTYAANGSMSGRSVSNETVDSDGIFAWNNINAGQYMVKMNLYVPEGSAGGYIGIGDNLMDINATYSSMYYIISGDTLLLVSDGAAYIAQAPLTPGAWDAVDLMVDLDANTSEIMVNGASVGTGTAGNGNMAINGLGAFDLWGTGINVFADPVEYNPGEFFYDDLEVIDMTGGAGIEENNVMAIGVAPNPSNGEFSIDFNDYAFDNASLTITNMMGAVVYTEKLSAVSNSSKNLNLDLNAGVYVLKVADNTNEFSSRIVIK
ncbi:MAG: T9SS type A sorting domain-containing protein [Crocinitomicaceae bacterium]|nr:T9SS type A sorting domain-containing protein [Crocinitomicaceae bacterium]